MTAPVKMKPFNRIMVSISGGSDSDVVMDLVLRSVDDKSKLHFVFFDTGIEYQATKDHLVYLENKYGIQIERIRPEKPIPLACRDHGQPFISKHVSEVMMRLQKHGFQWEDEPYDVLVAKYPKCLSALRWWCNQYDDGSSFNIKRNKWLKEFIVQNPPQFMISNKCCHFVKKNVAKDYKREHDIDLSVTGMRKAEGGARANAYKSCFTENLNGVSEYRPIWWFRNEDKVSYENEFSIAHSDCYVKYGLKRTGCAGCPIGRDLIKEREIIQQYEPKLYKAIIKIFGDSYEYTRRYRAFAEEMKIKQ